MYPPDYVDQIPIEEMSLTVAPGAKTQNNTQKENACRFLVTNGHLPRQARDVHRRNIMGKNERLKKAFGKRVQAARTCTIREPPSLNLVRENDLLKPVIHINDHITKTGSGQT